LRGRKAEDQDPNILRNFAFDQRHVETPLHDRYFLALLPDTAARCALAGLAPAGLGRPVHAEDLHLTLAFLGVLRTPTHERLFDALAPVARHRGPVQVVLDRLEVWPGPGAVCAAGDVPQVTGFAGALWPPLADLGYRAEDRPFKPHVTLSRGLPRAAKATINRLVTPVEWRSGEIVLMARAAPAGPAGSPRYAVIGRCPLD
jgi:RNA 2',3'-cyclic 3'-phosphodiesterase